MAWEELLDIIQEGADIARQERSADPVACPNDGEPLQQGADGGLYCKWDGWRPNGRYVGQ